MRSPRGGELFLSACQGVGNRPPSKKKIANPRGCAQGGMVTGRIEPCIIFLNTAACTFVFFDNCNAQVIIFPQSLFLSTVTYTRRHVQTLQAVCLT